MAYIKTKQGEKVLVDLEDLERLSDYSWSKYPSCRYVQSHINGKTTGIHRFIMNAPDGSNIDHINSDRLDNRKENLRFCTHAQNTKNRKPNVNGKSQYKGVIVLPNGRFRAKIDSDGVRHELGVYDQEREAVIAYNSAAKVLHGEHCYLNDLPAFNTRAEAQSLQEVILTLKQNAIKMGFDQQKEISTLTQLLMEGCEEGTTPVLTRIARLEQTNATHKEHIQMLEKHRQEACDKAEALAKDKTLLVDALEKTFDQVYDNPAIDALFERVMSQVADSKEG